MSAFDVTERGFKKYGGGTCSYGIKWRFQESSSAEGDRVFMYIDGTLQGGGKAADREQCAALHLTLENLQQMRDQIDAILDHETHDACTACGCLECICHLPEKP